MKKELTKLQGFNAMTRLFQIYYDLDSSDDIGGILGSMAFLQDKTTSRPNIVEQLAEMC